MTTRNLSAAHDEHHHSTADWLLVATPGLIWGASFLFIAEGLKSMGPYGVTFVRVLFGFLTLACFPSARKRIAPEAWRRIALLSVLWFAIPLSMFPLAEQHISSALAGMLNGCVPLFAAAVAIGIARKAPPPYIFAGLATGFLGSVLIALPSFQEGRSSAFAVFLIVIAIVSYGFAVNLARPLQQAYGAVPVIWRGLGIALVLLAPLGVPDMLHAHWTIGPAVSMVLLGAFGTGVAFIAMATAAGRVGATQASSTAFLIPPVSIVLGVALNHEHVAPLSIVGSVICVLGAWIIRPRAPKVAAEPVREVAAGQEAAASEAS